jgi:PAS domain S-box-containing protein
VARDCTLRKEAERNLRRSEEKYRHIIDNINEAYCEVDLNGDFLFCNNAAAEITGYSPEELAGRNYRQLMDDANAAAVYRVFNRVFRTQQPIKGFECEIRDRKGTSRHMDMAVLLLKDEGGPAHRLLRVCTRHHGAHTFQGEAGHPAQGTDSGPHSHQQGPGEGQHSPAGAAGQEGRDQAPA